MASHQNPVQTVNAILFTIDTTTNAFELTALALLSVALLTFAGAALGRPTGSRGVPLAWSGYSLLLGLAVLALSATYAIGNPNDLLLVATGALIGWTLDSRAGRWMVSTRAVTLSR